LIKTEIYYVMNSLTNFEILKIDFEKFIMMVNSILLIKNEIFIADFYLKEYLKNKNYKISIYLYFVY